MTFFLGIDVGTQSVKTLVFDASNRRVVAIASAPLDLISRRTCPLSHSCLRVCVSTVEAFRPDQLLTRVRTGSPRAGRVERVFQRAEQ